MENKILFGWKKANTYIQNKKYYSSCHVSHTTPTAGKLTFSHLQTTTVKEISAPVQSGHDLDYSSK